MQSSGTDRPAQEYPALDSFLKFAAVPGIVIYGVLFVAYRRYYTIVGLDPEDVGIDNSYIVSRSLGFVLLVLLFVGFATAAQIYDLRFSERISAYQLFLVKCVLGAPFIAFLAVTYSPEMPEYLRLMAFFVAGALPAVPLSTARSWSRWGDVLTYGIVVVAGVVLVTTALVSQAHYLADQVRGKGCAVEPVEYLYLPVVDVSAPRITVQWIGPPQQRPRYFADGAVPLEALLVGKSSSSAYLVLADATSSLQLVQLPSAQLSISTTDVAPPHCLIQAKPPTA